MLNFTAGKLNPCSRNTKDRRQHTLPKCFLKDKKKFGSNSEFPSQAVVGDPSKILIILKYSLYTIFGI